MRENEIIPVKKRPHKAENQLRLRFREKRECLGGERVGFCRERSKRNEPDFALDLFKENTSRWIEICRESIEH